MDRDSSCGLRVAGKTGVMGKMGGGKLALFGFVFRIAQGGLIFVILLSIGGYVHFGFLEIGFVLHINRRSSLVPRAPFPAIC